jgi:hypothetical protein
MEKLIDREDWMDCSFILAEELDKRGCSFEAFKLLAAILAEERRRPYFKLFTVEIENFIKLLVKSRLKSALDSETWIECLKTMMELGFSAQDKKRFMKSINDTLNKLRIRQ